MGRVVGILAVFLVGFVAGKYGHEPSIQAVNVAAHCPKPAPVTCADVAAESIKGCSQNLNICMSENTKLYDQLDSFSKKADSIANDFFKCNADQEYWKNKYLNFECYSSQED